MNFDNLADCITDLDKLNERFDYINQLLKTKNQTKIVEGVVQMAFIIEDLPQSYMFMCTDSAASVDALETWSEDHADIDALEKTVGENLNKQYGLMSVEFARAKYQYTNDMFFEFGEQIGSLLVTLSSPATQ